MSTSDSPLQLMEVGAYRELATRPNPDKYEIVFVPSLAALLVAQEKRVKRPLTEAEVMAVRDDATVSVMPPHDHSLAKARDYEDISPKNAWVAWQKLRLQLTKP